jgi:hypothetical protein
MRRLEGLQGLCAAAALAALAGCTRSVTVTDPRSYGDFQGPVLVTRNDEVEDCGWSLGFGVAGRADNTGPCISIESPLRDGTNRDQSLVLGLGLGTPPHRIWASTWDADYDETASSSRYVEKGRISYRRYCGPYDYVRSFWEMGLSFGTEYRPTLLSGSSDTHQFAYDPLRDGFHLVLGAGLRIRPKWTDSTGCRHDWLFIDIGFDVVSGMAAENRFDYGTAFRVGLHFGGEPLDIRHGRPWGRGPWSIDSAGPRMGFVHVTGPIAEAMEAEGEEPFLTLIGWQFEVRYEAEPDGPVGLVEFVPMFAGLEQGKALSSANLLFGARSAGGTELAAGPYLSPSGVGFTAAVGHTFRAGRMNLPVDLAVTTNPEGVRYSLTFGWNL